MSSNDIKKPRTFSMGDELYEELQAASKSLGLTASSLLRTFLVDGMSKLEDTGSIKLPRS